MRRAERPILYGLCAACLLFAFRATVDPQWVGRALAAVPPSAAPLNQQLATKLATCDVYGMVERLIETAPYYVPRKQEEERLKEGLAPLLDRLTALDTALQGSDPSKPENIAKRHDLDVKREEFASLRKQAQETFGRTVARQYADAYEKVQTAAAEIAREQGYTHVATQRGGPINTTPDAQKLAEEFLSRPYLVSPPGTDITEQVRIALKLPEKAVIDPALLEKPVGAKPGDGK